MPATENLTSGKTAPSLLFPLMRKSDLNKVKAGVCILSHNHLTVAVPVPGISFTFRRGRREISDIIYTPAFYQKSESIF